MTVGSATREVVAFKSVSVIPTDVNQMQHNGVDMGHYLYGQQATETIYTFESSGMRVDVKQLNGKAAETSCKYSIANYLGKSLVEVDEYGLKTEYTYDQYGNPLTQSSYNANGVLNRKVVLNYDADSEYSVQEKKYGSATQGHYRQTDIKTDKFGNVSSSNTRILSLDDNEEYVNSTTDNAVGVFNDKQLSSTFGGNGTYVQNSVTYQNGAIRTISDGTVKYGRIRTRKPNEDSVAYTQFTQSGAEEILRKDTVKRTGTNNQNTLNTTDFYNNEGKICYTKTSVADKYGKVGKITVNNKDRVVYTYRNANESELSAQVETVQDTATGVTRKYLFDDDGNRIGWKDYPTSAGQKKSQLIVRSVGEGVVKYSFAVDEANNKSEDYLTVATYDNNKMNPRITETSVMEDEGTKFETDAFKDIVDYHRKYVYNDDGELQRKYEPFNEDIIAEETTYGYTDVDGEKYVNNLTHKMRCISVGEQNEYTNRCTYTGTNVTQYESDLIYSPDSQRYDALKHVFERKYYRYDQFNRLVEEGVGNPEKHLGVKEYSYLSNGRHKVFAGKNCEYDNMGRMSSCGTTSYDYDFYGNRTKEVDGSTTIEYSYLDKEQLYSVSKNGKAVASYRYDAEGNRDCKSLADGTKITYYLDGNKLLGEDRTKDNKTHKLRYFYDAFGIIGFKYDDDYYCYIKDIFGSVVALSKQVKSTNDIYEQVVASYKYTTYGECTVLDSNGDKVDPSFSTFIGNVNPIRWNSHYFDAESGLYYMNCSYFDPKNGQYVDSRQISSLFDEILHSKGLDRLGIPCNNIFAIAIYLCTIQGVIKLSADPTYDMEANLPWWAKVRQAIAEFFADLNDHTTKVFMLILSCMLAFMAIYLAAQVAVAEAVTVVVKLVVGTLTGIASALAMQAISGEEITWESVRDAAIDSFFWTSVFVFASVLSSSLKGVLRSSSTANGECRTGNCFIAGTLVHTRQGVKPIEDISVGDQVLAYDEETGEQSYKKVVRLFRNTTDEWYHVAFGKEELVCTAAHPFYVVDKGFVPACELMLGDKLVLANGSKTEVRSIAVECLPESEVTYNFEVEDFHTYYVSDSAVLVHNTCLDPEANADYYVQYRTQGKTVNAYHQESGIYKNKFIAPDVTKHGGSQFKLLRKAKGSKLRLIGDIDDTGKFIFAKNSSNVGNLYSYFGGGRLK